MNPLKQIKDFFVFIYNDFKSDYVFIRDVIKGKREIRKFSKDEVKQMFNIKEIMKDYWIFFLIIILAFVVGWFAAAKYYQFIANEYLINNCMNFTSSHPVPSWGFNLTNITKII